MRNRKKLSKAAKRHAVTAVSVFPFRLRRRNTCVAAGENIRYVFRRGRNGHEKRDFLSVLTAFGQMAGKH